MRSDPLGILGAPVTAGWNLLVSRRKYHAVHFFFFWPKSFDDSHCRGLKRKATLAQRIQVPLQCLARTRYKLWKALQRCRPPLWCFVALCCPESRDAWSERTVWGSLSCGPGESLGVSEDPASSLSLFLFHLHFYASLFKWEHFLCSLPQAQSSQGDKELL